MLDDDMRVGEHVIRGVSTQGHNVGDSNLTQQQENTFGLGQKEICHQSGKKVSGNGVFLLYFYLRIMKFESIAQVASFISG